MTIVGQFKDEVVAVGGLHGLKQTDDVGMTHVLQQKSLTPEVTSCHVTSDHDAFRHDLYRHLVRERSDMKIEKLLNGA